MKLRRSHPYEILTGFRGLILLIVPILIKSSFSNFDNIYISLSNSVLNLIIAVYLVLYVIFIYINKLWRISKSDLYIKTGVINKRSFFIKANNIHSVTVYRGLIMSVFRVRRLNINYSGLRLNILKNLYLSKGASIDFIKRIFGKIENGFEYRVGFMRILIMCLSWSNPAAGVFIVIPLLKKIVRILGTELSKRVYSTVDISPGLIAAGIPPVTSSLIFVTIFIIFITLSFKIFKYGRFSVTIGENSVCIKRGLISRISKVIKKECITSISINQTLLMKLLRLYSVNLYSIVDRGEKSEADFMAASLGIQDSRLLASKIVNISNGEFNTIRPEPGSLKSFLTLPVTLMSALFLGTFIKPTGIYGDLFSTLLIILWIYAIWWFIVKILAFRNSNLTFSGDILSVYGYKKFSLIKAIIPIKKIQNIVIKQNPFQYIFNKCNICIYTCYNYKEYFSVKHLKYSDVEKFVESLENLSISD